MAKRNIIFLSNHRGFVSCLNPCMFGLRRREKHHNPFKWHHYILILYLDLSRYVLLQVYCCYDPTSFTQFTSLPVAVKYHTASLIREDKHTRTLIYFTVSKFKMHSESFSQVFKKTVTERSNYESSNFLTDVIFL